MYELALTASWTETENYAEHVINSPHSFGGVINCIELAYCEQFIITFSACFESDSFIAINNKSKMFPPNIKLEGLLVELDSFRTINEQSTQLNALHKQFLFFFLNWFAHRIIAIHCCVLAEHVPKIGFKRRLNCIYNRKCV